ncbi:hypothetical protein B7L81_sORF2gp1 [Beauveria bassiana polymycovirus 1]|uniref:Uncharacterized protein n=1 Tax=Beauveria bassiana polymycovirus 1 TaxID=1740646 RepID=A0A1V1IEU5_9VIRU|nr:hypothetical protein B7L81_sORF2gp1 [Beauveria bassiana polymycovirus 1]CUS18596.1 protein of unknown function [Beauveria bassiana polymycovirus 1]
MADLTRLSAIAVDVGSPAPAVAAVLDLFGVSDPTGQCLSSAQVMSVVEWIAGFPLQSAPGLMPAYVFEYVKSKAGSLVASAGVCDDVAYFLRHFEAPDEHYTKSGRSARVAQVALNKPLKGDGAHLGAVELALLDAVTRVGYVGPAGALASVARLRTMEVLRHYAVDVRQRACAQYRVTCQVCLPGRDSYPLITPWCVSRQSATICAGVILASVGGEAATKAVQRRAVTVASHAARIGLDAVRAIVAPACRLVAEYSFDPVRLVLTDRYGRVRERITSRSPAATVAFAYLTSRGSADPLLAMASERVERMGPVELLPQCVQDYWNQSEDIVGMLSLFCRALHLTRVEREEEERGRDVNKGPCLGYLAVGRKKRDRNTASCINRLCELMCEVRALGQSPEDLLFVVEWGGQIDSAAVPAFCAMARVDCAFDVGASGVDIGGVADPGKSLEVHHYTAVLTHRVGRTLSVCCEVPYAKDSGVNDRIRTVVDAVGEGVKGFVYVSGGIPAVASMSAEQSVNDAHSDIYAALVGDAPLKCILFSTDLIIPPACPHCETVDLDHFLASRGVLSEDCRECTVFGRALRLMSELMSTPGVRLVKTRSAFAHNSQFDLEYSSLLRNTLTDSSSAVDSAAFSTGARNRTWGGGMPVGSDDLVAAQAIGGTVDGEFYDRMVGIRRNVYALLAGGAQPRPALADDTFSDVVRSVGA